MEELAAKKTAALYGRADIYVEQILHQHLRAEAAPLYNNPTRMSLVGQRKNQPEKTWLKTSASGQACACAKGACPIYVSTCLHLANIKLFNRAF